MPYIGAIQKLDCLEIETYRIFDEIREKYNLAKIEKEKKIPKSIKENV